MKVPRSQDLSGGPDSTNLQAGRDIVYNGVTATQAREIALDVYNANFLKLAGVAEDVARDRAERITREFVEALQARNPAGLASMGDPDMLRTLYNAQEGYACSGEDDLEQALIDLLVDRAGQAERDLKTHVLNQAVATLPKLTKNQRAAVTVVFSVKYTRYTGPFDLSAFYDYLVRYLVPFVADIPESSADFGYMEYTGVGSVINFAITPLASAYQNQAYGFFSNGFTRDAAPDPWSPFLDDPEVFMPCLRDSQKLQIRARSMAEVQELAKAKSIPTLVTHASTGSMQDPEVRADMIAHVPSLEILFDKWGEAGSSSSASFQLTAVGIAIGHACQRKVVGDAAPLDAFLV
jgi:hypothetical protein